MAGIKTTVTCPKCGKSFDYEFVPGGSFTAVRLGNYRYMRCRKCRRWALFNITKNLSRHRRNHLANSSIIAGIALLALGIALFWTAFKIRVMALEIAGIVVLAVAFMAIWVGIKTVKM